MHIEFLHPMRYQRLIIGNKVLSKLGGVGINHFSPCIIIFLNSGDPRRPYPTDVEMRIGLLGRPESAAIEISRTAQSSGERGAAAAAAAASSVVGTPGARTPSSYGPSAGPMSAGAGPGPVHPQDFHHPSPQHHMGKEYKYIVVSMIFLILQLI